MDTIPREILKYLLQANITYVEDISSICSTCKEWKKFRDLEWRIIDDEMLIIDLKFLTKFPNITTIEGPYLFINHSHLWENPMGFVHDLLESCSPINPTKKLKHVKLVSVDPDFVPDMNKIFSSCDHLEIYSVDDYSGGKMIEYMRCVLGCGLSTDEDEGNLIFRRKEEEEGTEIYCHRQFLTSSMGLPNLSRRNISSISLRTLHNIITNPVNFIIASRFPKGFIENIEPSTIYSGEDYYIEMLRIVISDMVKGDSLGKFRRFIYKGVPIVDAEEYYEYRDTVDNIIQNLIYYIDITKIERLDILLDVRDAMKYELKGLKLKKYHLLYPDDFSSSSSNEDDDEEDLELTEDACNQWIEKKMKEGVEIIIQKED